MANVKISNVKCPTLTSLSLNGSEMSLAPPKSWSVARH